MRSPTFKSAAFSNKLKEIEVVYTTGKRATLPYASLNLKKKIQRIWVDKETKGKSVGMEFEDGLVDYLPYDQPLAIVKDPEYILQNHIERITARIKDEIARKKISRRFLAQQLKTSENRIQRLLNPEILNKNLGQLYKMVSLLGLECEIQIRKAA